MSYDISIFFYDGGGLDQIAKQVGDALGLPLQKPPKDYDRFECRLLGLDFDLHHRNRFLKDDDMLEFSRYSYQLDITSRLAGFDIITPVSFMISETLSENFSGRVMLCISSVEILGAVFECGKLIVDNMTKANELFSGTAWCYSRRKVI